MATLFEERHFSWPDQPGNQKREAKLPWFWFTDVGEARQYLQLWWLWQSIGGLLFLNFWLVKNHALGFFLLGCLVLAQAAFLRVWIPLCKRASPPPSKWDWFAANWFNPKSRHCLLMAWDVLKEHNRKEAGDAVTAAEGPLADLRVIDVATVLAGPGCARYLADFGADVIKVERPGEGDTLRSLGWRDPADDVTLFWKLGGRGKRSIVLDLKDADDLEVMRRLIDTADVLVENFRPGKLEALGLAPDDLIANSVPS